MTKKHTVLLIVSIVLLLFMAGVAVAATLATAQVPWFAAGGAGATISSGEGHALTGAAGMAGAHGSRATGGAYALNGGYVPARSAVIVPPGSDDTIWLPIVTSKASE